MHLSPSPVEESLLWIGERPIVGANILVRSMHSPASRYVLSLLQVVVRLQSQLGNGQDHATKHQDSKNELEDHSEREIYPLKKTSCLEVS